MIVQFYFVCMAVLLACYLHTISGRLEGGIGFPRTIVTGSCEMPSGCWAWSSGSREDRPALLTTQLFLQPLSVGFDVMANTPLSLAPGFS